MCPHCLVILESAAQQKERRRQAYLRLLERYRRDTRAIEQRTGVTCEIYEYPEKYKMARTCWSIDIGRRSGPRSKPRDVQTVPRDTTRKLRSVLTSN